MFDAMSFVKYRDNRVKRGSHFSLLCLSRKSDVCYLDFIQDLLISYKFHTILTY